MRSSIKNPKHISIIMDGNGRWASIKGLSRTEGHRAGVKSVRRIIKYCSQLGIKYLTLFTFSQENWSRPKKEVFALMKLWSLAWIADLKRCLHHLPLPAWGAVRSRLDLRQGASRSRRCWRASFFLYYFSKIVEHHIQNINHRTAA